MRTALPLFAALMLLQACATSPAEHGREAGAGLDYGSFGNATMNNMLVQTGQGGHRIDLARRFAAEVPSTINFGFNSAALDAQAQAVLRQQAGWIRQFPEVHFKVYGHTDLVGSRGYNQSLGLRRAQAAVGYLVSLGVSPGQLEAVVSYGETQPLIVTEGRERANRRTVTDVDGFVADHPNVLNGKYAEVIFRGYVESAVSEPTSEISPAPAAGAAPPT